MKYFYLFLISMFPFTELRLSLPLGIINGLDKKLVFLFCVLGNIFPILPLFFFYRYLLKFLETKSFLGKFLTKWFKKVEKKSDLVKKYGFLGLFIFVGVPFPGTGVWTATAIAVLLRMKALESFLAMTFGVLLAGFLVVEFSAMLNSLINFFKFL